jgi:hypothetical protein
MIRLSICLLNNFLQTRSYCLAQQWCGRALLNRRKCLWLNWIFLATITSRMIPLLLLGRAKRRCSLFQQGFRSSATILQKKTLTRWKAIAATIRHIININKISEENILISFFRRWLKVFFLTKYDFVLHCFSLSHCFSQYRFVNPQILSLYSWNQSIK